MQTSGSGTQIIYATDNSSQTFGAVGENGYREPWLQRLLYQHPEALPVAEIDASFCGLIPLCLEMYLPGGRVDAVYVTPSGKLILLEAKLCSNPEARREVIGQILDYAAVLAGWDYSELDVAVRQARKNMATDGGDTVLGIFEVVARETAGLEPHGFKEAVTKSLRKGDFLLLVVGNRIRDEVSAITQYLNKNDALHFTFGLIECAIYTAPDGGRFIHPQVRARSEKLIRTIVQRRDGGQEEIIENESDGGGFEDRPDLVESREKHSRFWKEFLTQIHVEFSQPIPPPARGTILNFPMPLGSAAMVTALLWHGEQQAIVYLRFKKDPHGDKLFSVLLQDRLEIDQALGIAVEWRVRPENEQNNVIISRKFPGGLLTESKAEAQKWLVDQTDAFIGVFRPRIEQILREQG